MLTSYYTLSPVVDVRCVLHIFTVVDLAGLLSECIACLLNDASDETSGDGPATLTDVEALTLLDGNGLVDLADHPSSR